MVKCMKTVIEKEIKEIFDDPMKAYLLLDPLRRRRNEKLYFIL